jgi:cytochrome c peroxidase
MLKQFIIIGGFILTIIAFSFFTQRTTAPADKVKMYYLQQAKQFEKEITVLQELVAAGNEKQLQQQFIKARLAYKKIETVVEYYFNFFAIKLNGPAIPFFEEDEPDMGQQQPAGMQLIEGMLFPSYNKSSCKVLDSALTALLFDIQTMQATSESNAFSDELIFDAVTEELFRITALGITGFDSQSAANGLTECSAALSGVEKIVQFYQDSLLQIPVVKSKQLWNLLAGAKLYLQQHSNFNSFNRMQFIQDYLDPVTQIVGAYKQAKGFIENRSPLFYSTIKKNNGLFAKDIFDVNKYLDDNTTSTDKINLGRQLFFDKQLSTDNKRSCATCHDPAKAFTDGLSRSIAIDGHTVLSRNAPTLWNAALQRNLFLDSRSFSLEEQVMAVLNNASEMHGSAQHAAEHIIIQKGYDTLYTKAYPAAQTTTAAQNICNAIACYERTLIALNSKFDKHMRGQPALNNSEINGFNLFMGKAKCGTCHFMPLFGGAKPPRYYYNETEVIGVPASNTAPAKLDQDAGRFIVTGLPLHKFAFKTSSLRNIALTAPYMHNGVFKTLAQVLDFYNNGGGKGLKISPKNQTLPFDKLQLSTLEKRDIIAFLKTLTDTAQSQEPLLSHRNL